MLLEARLGVNALSTQFLQVNSDSLIVALGSVTRSQFKRSAKCLKKRQIRVWNKANVLSTRFRKSPGPPAVIGNLIEPTIE